MSVEKKKKRVNGGRKGSAFERAICRKLSLWFSHGNREDLFHRTAGSGARSTTRAKKGKNTANSAGDIGYLDAAGKPLIEAITFELKCGYNKIDTTSLIDTPKHNKKPQLWEFIRQATISGQNAQSRYWMVIHRRNGKQTLSHIPILLWNCIREFFNKANGFENIQFTYLPTNYGEPEAVVSLPLELFLEKVPPEGVAVLNGSEGN